MANPDFIPLGGAPKESPVPLESAGGEKPLQNVAGEGNVSGMLKNLGTSVIKGIPHIPSPMNPVFVSDLQNLTDYLVMRAHSALSGKSMEELQKRRADFKAKMKEATPSWMPDISLPQGEDVSSRIFNQLDSGEYTPTTPAGRIGSAMVQAATAMGPGSVANVGKRVLMGGLSGGAGETATEYTGEPLMGLAVGAATPNAAAKIGSMTAKAVRPYRPSQRQSMADELLLNNTRNPEQAMTDLNKIAPGSAASTAEITMDPGHIIADKLAKARSTEYQQMSKERQTAQNTARRGVIASLGPDADPVDVANAFHDHLSEVEADHTKTVAGLESRAKERSAGITGMEAEEVGKSLRDEVKAEDSRFKKYFNKAFDALDPDKKLNVLAHPVTDKANEILNRPNRDIEPESKLAQSALEKAQGLDQVVSFDRLRTLDTTLTKLMAEARRNSDPGYHDIAQLKSAVKDAFANAVENQIKHEADLVARGQMNPEDTFAHKLRQQVESYYANKEQSAAAAGTGQDGTVRSGSVSGTTGKGGGSGAPASGEGLPRPNLEPDTAQRLSALNKEYGEYRSLYGADPIAGTLKTSGFKDQFAVPDSKLVAKAFPAGDGGYEATNQFLKAGNNQTLADVKSIAVGRLREMMKGETLTPEVLNAWKAKYAPALRAIEANSPGFTDNFNTAASTTRALNRAIADQKMAVADAQKGIAAKFLGLKDASDVVAEIGKAMNASNSGQKIGELVDRLKGNDAALAGARKAATDWLLGKASNAGVTQADEHVLSAPKVVNFVRDNPDAIRKLWGEQGLNYLKSVAEDMERSQKLLTAQATAGSDTASKMLGKMIAEAEEHAQKGTISTGDALNLVAVGEVFHGEPFTALKIKGLQAAIEKAQGFLSHRRGAGIAEVNRMFMEGLDNPEVAKAMLERATTPDGKVNAAAFAKLAGLLGMTHQAEEAERRGRADGGPVSKIDYAAKAEQLLRMAEKAKKAHGAQTKSLLKYPDELISSALKLANRDV